MSTVVQNINLLKEMISIPATSRKEDARAAFLAAELEAMGLQVKRIHNNLLVKNPVKGELGKRILLNSHLDTVAPAEGWAGDPFLPVHRGERITGLGTNDAGASVVSMIAAFRKMAPALEGVIDLMLLISAEEEVSGDKGISSVLPFIGNLDGVIVGEPTGMQPAVAERGLMVLDGEAKGKAGHAARNEGINAITLAMKDIGAMASLSYEEKSEWLPDPGAQVTMISAGTGHNVVPDICRFVVDVRSNDHYGNERMLHLLQEVCNSSLQPRSMRLNSSRLDRGHVLMKAIEASGLTPFGSSTLSDMALIPFPGIKMGPGNSARSHTAGEFILESELEAGVAGYCALLETLAEQCRLEIS
jgi:acetylornithine deacetylase